MNAWLTAAAANGLIAVAAGAYGRHGLAVPDPYFREVFEIGVTYQMWHALALLAVAWLAENGGGRPARLAGIGFIAGIALFSGSLYALGLTGTVSVPGAAPVGGVLLMGGWAALIWAGLRRRRGGG